MVTPLTGWRTEKCVVAAPPTPARTVARTPSIPVSEAHRQLGVPLRFGLPDVCAWFG
jgi:hypothetical protein